MGQQYVVDVSAFNEDQLARLHRFVTSLVDERQAAPKVRSPERAGSGVMTWSTLDEPSSTGWNLAYVAMLLNELSVTGRDVQRRAVESCDATGFISRESIYRIGQYPPERRLNKWAMPFDTAKRVLVQHAGLPSAAADPVTADYPEASGYTPALGYRVNREIVGLMRGATKLVAPLAAVVIGDVILSGESVGAVVVETGGGWITVVSADGETHTVSSEVLTVWRKRGPTFLVDTESNSTDDSQEFMRRERERFGTFVSAVIYRGNSEYPGLLLTDDAGAHLALLCFNAGYHGAGPEATVEALVAEGFGRATVEALVYASERERTPAMIER